MMRNHYLEMDQANEQAEAIWKNYLEHPNQALTFPRSMELGDLVRRGIVVDIYVHALLANRIQREGEGYDGQGR